MALTPVRTPGAPYEAGTPISYASLVNGHPEGCKKEKEGLDVLYPKQFLAILLWTELMALS